MFNTLTYLKYKANTIFLPWSQNICVRTFRGLQTQLKLVSSLNFSCYYRTKKYRSWFKFLSRWYISEDVEGAAPSLGPGKAGDSLSLEWQSGTCGTLNTLIYGSSRTYKTSDGPPVRHGNTTCALYFTVVLFAEHVIKS